MTRAFVRSPFFLVVDYCANFGVEFFLHAADDRVLLGATCLGSVDAE